MMLACPTCRTLHPLNAPAASVDCYLCGTRMRVPGPDKTHETQVEAGNTTMDKNIGPSVAKPSSSQSPSPAPRAARGKGKMRCPECRVTLQISAGYGKNVQCPLCTTWFRFDTTPTSVLR